MFAPRRLVRSLIYFLVFGTLALIFLLAANRNRIIHLDDILPPDLLPQYFQPASDSYLVDIAVVDCTLLSKNSKKCGVPKAAEGPYGDVGSNGGWTRVEKDLLLSKHWTTRRYVSLKRISAEHYEKNRDVVILDIAVGDPVADCAMKGNVKCIPKDILTEINMGHVFNGEDLERLRYLNKDEKANFDTETSKAAPDASDAQPEEPAQEETNQEEGDAEEEEDVADDGKYKGEESLPKESSPESESEDTVSENVEKTEGESEEPKEEAEEAEEAESTEETKEKRDSSNPLRKRYVETSHHNLKNYMRIPTDEEIARSGWTKKSHNIWVKFGPASDLAVTGVDVLFGEDAVDPRPNWALLRTPLKKLAYSSDLQPRLTIRKGARANYKARKYQPKIQFDSAGKFKVLQVADLHFSTGVGTCRDPVPAEGASVCQADPRTLKFVNRVLDLEKPDFVVMSGDQVFGDAAPDPETALFKAVHPFVKRGIPFAITLGNHDDESIMSREQMMHLASSLPFSYASVGPQEVDGFGNYVLSVKRNGSSKSGAVFYFLDSHSRSPSPKTNPGYDWFKQSQVDWVSAQAKIQKAKANSLLSMAFFHIPLPEYRNLDQPRVGEHREGITAPVYETGMRQALGSAGVQVASCGHDHANDYCLVDTQKADTKKAGGADNSMWLCYGGGVGEGGYGGYGGYIRRLRVYELDYKEKTIKTWKRAENKPDDRFDKQTVVDKGQVVTTDFGKTF